MYIDGGVNMPYDIYGSYYDEDELEEDDDEGVPFDTMVSDGVVDEMSERQLRNEYRGTFAMLPLILDGVAKPKRRKFF